MWGVRSELEAAGGWEEEVRIAVFAVDKEGEGRNIAGYVFSGWSEKVFSLSLPLTSLF